jgi:hypothetical protein
LLQRYGQFSSGNAAATSARAGGVQKHERRCECVRHENGIRGFHRHARLLAARLNDCWLLGGPGTPTDANADILAGLSPEEQEAVLQFIEFLRFKKGK